MKIKEKKAKSKSQQKLMQDVVAYKKGEIKNPSTKVKDASDGVTLTTAQEMADTDTKGLPNVKESLTFRQFLKESGNLSELSEIECKYNVFDIDREEYKNDDEHYKIMVYADGWSADVKIRIYEIVEEVAKDEEDLVGIEFMVEDYVIENIDLESDSSYTVEEVKEICGKFWEEWSDKVDLRDWTDSFGFYDNVNKAYE